MGIGGEWWQLLGQGLENEGSNKEGLETVGEPREVCGPEAEAGDVGRMGLGSVIIGEGREREGIADEEMSKICVGVIVGVERLEKHSGET